MTNLIPGAWRINIVSKGFLPEGCHGVVAKADSNDFYIEEHLAEDFLDRLHETYIQHEPSDEEFDVTGCEFKMGDDSMEAAEEPTGIPAFGLTMDQVQESFEPTVPQALANAIQDIIEGLDEPIVTGTFVIDGLSKDAVEIEQSADGHSTIYWKDGSWTAYDETGQKIDHFPDDFSTDEVFATTFKDYVKKMFKPSKWKLGE